MITAQHRDMLDSVLSIFDIQADHDLNIMQDQQTLADLTANTLAKLDSIINEEQPDMILVHGDTTTTFVGSLAAFYHQPGRTCRSWTLEHIRNTRHFLKS